MVNKIEWLEKIINETTTPIVVYTKRGNCESRNEKELKFEELLNKNNRNYPIYILCYTMQNMPFPEVADDRIHFFLPKNQRPMIGGDMDFFIENFDIAIKNFDNYLDPNNSSIINDTEYIEPSFPSTGQMIKNVANQIVSAGKELLNGNGIFVDEEIVKKRLEICKQCENYVDERCKLCGCFMSAKTKLVSAKCDINKW